MNVVEKVPFKLFPLNKTNDNTYSYFASSPLINFQFEQNGSRVIDPSSLKLVGRFRVFNKNSDNRAPANRFDVNGTANALPQEYEKVCYPDDRVSVSSCIQTLTISNLKGQIFEQIREYNRMLSSLLGASASFRDYCSVYQNTWGAYPNNDCVSRAVSGDQPFALPLRSGFLMEPQPISLANGGLKLTINLSSDSVVLYGLNGGDFVYELRDLFLSGNYLVLDKPVAPQKGAMLQYHQFYNYLNTLNSGNDHQNLALNLSEVVSVYSNFIPSSWTANSSYNGMSTPKLKDGATFSDVNINRIKFNRGAVSYPLTFPIDELRANQDSVFDALRSRKFLNSIAGYYNLTHSTISPESEDIEDMITDRNEAQNLTSTNRWLRTPQGMDNGDVPAWSFANNAAWNRGGTVEKSGRVFGIGFRADQLVADIPQNYDKAAYNYVIESGHNADLPNSVYTFCLAKSTVFADGQGGVVAQN